MQTGAVILTFLTAAAMASPALAQERPAPPPPVVMPADHNPLAYLKERVGGIWIASEAEQAPDGRMFYDAKLYREAAAGFGIAVTNYRLFEDGRRFAYLEGLYYVDPDGRQLRHVAVFAGGGLVDRAEASFLRGQDVHFLTFEFTAPGATPVTSVWRSREEIDEDGALVEVAQMWEEEAWHDIGTTRYARYPEDVDVLTLFASPDQPG